MKKTLLGLTLAVASAASAAKIVCPPMPDAVTQVNRDVRSSIEVAVGSVAKVKAGDVSIQTDVSAKNLFEKFPNADKIVVMQMMSATYCSILASSTEMRVECRPTSMARSGWFETGGHARSTLLLAWCRACPRANNQTIRHYQNLEYSTVTCLKWLSRPGRGRTSLVDDCAPSAQ